MNPGHRSGRGSDFYSRVRYRWVAGVTVIGSPQRLADPFRRVTSMRWIPAPLVLLVIALIPPVETCAAPPGNVGNADAAAGEIDQLLRDPQGRASGGVTLQEDVTQIGMQSSSRSDV